MNKCLKITFEADMPEGYLQDFFQKHAKKLKLEGIAQITSGKEQVKIVVCGDKDLVDEFVDFVHKAGADMKIENLEIEPFIKDKDYRGVFRVIE